jgi:hypothetical protein
VANIQNTLETRDLALLLVTCEPARPGGTVHQDKLKR